MSPQITLLPIAGGPLDTNAWLVVDETSREALLIDAPPETHDRIVAAVTERGLRLTQIVLTHTHWDHIVDAQALRASLDAPLIAHPNAIDRLASPGRPDLPYRIDAIAPDATIDDGDAVPLGDTRFTVWFAPGHDPAHIVLIDAANDGDSGILLGGDVLFPGGHGRTDIPGADDATMARTIGRLLELPDHVTVYPGHGDTTTIGAERHWMTRMAAGQAT